MKINQEGQICQRLEGFSLSKTGLFPISIYEN